MSTKWAEGYGLNTLRRLKIRHGNCTGDREEQPRRSPRPLGRWPQPFAPLPAKGDVHTWGPPWAPGGDSHGVK